MKIEKNKREFKGIWIPKEIWLNSELSIQEKIVLAEIDSFETDEGCFASNAYLGKIIHLSASRISGIISKLIKLGYVTSRMTYVLNSKEVDKRFLTVNKMKIYNL